MNTDRRDFIKGTVVMAGSVFSFLQEMRGHTITSLLIQAEEKADPIVFDSSEILTLAAVASQIIPTTDQPGAAEVGVVVYINAQVSRAPELAALYRRGIQDLDRTAQARFKQPFHQVPVDAQTQLLQAVEKSPFFMAVRRHTVEAFYTSPVGVYVASGYRSGTTHGLCSGNEGFLDADRKPKQ